LCGRWVKFHEASLAIAVHWSIASSSWSNERRGGTSVSGTGRSMADVKRIWSQSDPILATAAARDFNVGGAGPTDGAV